MFDRKACILVSVAALGYFVDVFDLILFSIVRVQSLKDLGLRGDELLEQGGFLLNVQLIGLLLGGILWGVMGDRRGRVSVLFGSIITYSLANIANAFVTTVDQYAICRFISGIGLAGELGAGITLVSESLPKEHRGWGTTVVAMVGVMGAIVAGLTGELISWQGAYVCGGIGGLLLLFLRVSIHESGIFANVTRQDISRGNLLMLLSTRDRALRYLGSILIGIPAWFFVAILTTFSPEVSTSLGVSTPVKASYAVVFSYIGFTFGDLISGTLSQIMKSRKKVLFIFNALLTVVSLTMLLGGLIAEPSHYYLSLALGGTFAGCWAVIVTVAAEQFGTNLRATAATTVPNFIRGAAVPITIFFLDFKGTWGIPTTGAVLCIGSSLLALLGLSFIRETFGTDLDFVEK